MITGPSLETSIAFNALWSDIIELNKRLKRVEMSVESQMHGQIIGANGSIYKRIVTETGCSTVIDSRANKVIIEGSPKATEEVTW